MLHRHPLGQLDLPLGRAADGVFPLGLEDRQTGFDLTSALIVGGVVAAVVVVAVVALLLKKRGKKGKASPLGE